MNFKGARFMKRKGCNILLEIIKFMTVFVFERLLLKNLQIVFCNENSY